MDFLPRRCCSFCRRRGGFVPLGEGEDGEGGDAPTQQSAKSAWRTALTMALPLVLSDLLFYLITFVALLYAGHLGPSRFAAAILATMITNVTGFSVGIGSKPPLRTSPTPHEHPSTHPSTRRGTPKVRSPVWCFIHAVPVPCAPHASLALPAHPHSLALSLSLPFTHTHTRARAQC